MNKRYGKQQDDMIELRDIATMLETISNKANQTGARLEKLELLRQQIIVNFQFLNHRESIQKNLLLIILLK